MVFDQLREQVLPEISEELNKDFPFAHILVMDRSAQGTDVSDKGRNVQHTDGELYPGSWNMNTRSAVITIYNGNNRHDAYTTDISPEGIQKAARELSDSLTPTEPTIPYQIPEFRRVERYISPRERDAREISVEERVEALCELEQRARQIGQSEEFDLDLNLEYHQMHTTELLVGPHMNGLQELAAVRVRLNYRVAENGKVMAHTVRPGGSGFEVIQIPDEELEAAIRFGRQKCHAVPLPEGTRDAIGSPLYNGVVVHEAGGHGLEGDTIAQMIARARLTVGQKVASKYVTVVSDPTKEGFGNYCFDHEGIIGKRIILIDEGAQTYAAINDFMTATITGQPVSGHGRRQSPLHAINSRQSYTGFEPLSPGQDGYMSFEDQVESMGQGIVIRDISGGMEDPHGNNVQIDSGFGEIVKGGRLTGQVCLAPSIKETVLRFYSSVEGISGGVGRFAGSCGKWHGDWVAVDGAAPYMLFRNVRIVGK